MIRSQAELKTSPNSRIIELFRFGSVGVINTLIDFTVFTFLTYALGINVSLSQAIGYSSGVMNSFIMNKSWTFKQEQQNKPIKQFISFIIINLISLGISSLMINVLVNSAGISILISKILVTLVTQGVNYVGYKLVVFK